MVFGPRRRAPECHVQLGGVSLPVVLSFKFLGVVLSPTLSWSKHVQIWSAEATASSHSACTGAALNICQFSWHPRSSAFMFSPVSRGDSELFAQSPTALRLMDNALPRWGRHLLGGPAGSPYAGVLCELGWPDAEHLALGRLLSLFGRTSFMAQGPASPLPASILRVAPESPATGVRHALDMCSRLSIRRWADSASELRCHVQRLISRLSTTRLPYGDVLSVNCGPGRLTYERGSSPERVRLWGLAPRGSRPAPLWSRETRWPPGRLQFL